MVYVKMVNTEKRTSKGTVVTRRAPCFKKQTNKQTKKSHLALVVELPS